MVKAAKTHLSASHKCVRINCAVVVVVAYEKKKKKKENHVKVSRSVGARRGNIRIVQYSFIHSELCGCAVLF